MSLVPALLGKLAMPGVDQVASVVRDIDRAMAELTGLGIGPWLQMPGGSREVLVRGRPEVVNFRVALAPFGAVQLELIQPVDGSSIYQEHLETKGEGLHHLGFLVPNFEERMAAMTERGIDVLMGSRPGSSVNFAYLDATKSAGIIFELLQATPSMVELFDRVRQSPSKGSATPT